MSRRVRIAIAVAIGVVLLTAFFGYFLNETSGDDGPAQPQPGTPLFDALERASAAPAPWGDGWTEALISANERCMTVLVADTAFERVQGLRAVTDLGVYDGMLFVFPEDVSAWFTMADTLMPLDIDWYTIDGTYVSSEEMTPCPEGNDGDCPVYGATAPYRYALETQSGGGAGGGTLGGCG
jgi:uncharacterized membrane protein (UPF0127 family)